MATDSDYYGEEDSGSPHKEKEGTPVTMLSKSVFGGKSVSPGDKITLVVKKVHDDEVSVEFTSKGDKKPEPAPDESPEPVEDDSEMQPEAQDLYA